MATPSGAAAVVAAFVALLEDQLDAAIGVDRGGDRMPVDPPPPGWVWLRDCEGEPVALVDERGADLWVQLVNADPWLDADGGQTFEEALDAARVLPGLVAMLRELVKRWNAERDGDPYDMFGAGHAADELAAMLDGDPDLLAELRAAIEGRTNA